MKKSFNRGRNSRSQSNFEPEQLECEVCGCYYVRADQRDEHLLLEHGILPKIPASKNSNKQKHPSFNISSNSSQTNSFRQVAFEILKVEKNKLRDEVLELLNKHQESLPLDSQTIHLGNDLTETNKPQNENNTERQDASRSRIDNEIESDVVLDISVGRKLELEDGSSKIGAEAIEKSENDATNELKRRCDSENDYSSAKRADLGYPILKIEPMEQELPDEHEISDKQLPIRQIRDELTLDKQISANQIPSDQIPSDQIPYEEFSAEQPATEQISENKLTKSQNSNPEKTSYHCLVCSKSFTSQKQYRLHYNSIQHKTIIDGFRRPETGKPHGLRPVYHCATCCIDFPNPSGLVRHFNSKCHRDIFFGVAKRKNENSASKCLGVRKPPEPRQLLMDRMSGAGKMNKFSYTNENSQYENSKNENSHKKIKINPASNEDLRQHVLSRQFHTPTISESGSHNFSSDPVKLKDTFLTIAQQLVRQPHTSTPNPSSQVPVSNETIHANQLLTNLALMQLLNPQLTNDNTFGQHLQNLNFQSAQQVQQALLIQQLQSTQNIQNDVQRQLNLEKNQPHSSFQQTVNFLPRKPQKCSKFPKTTIDKTDEIP